MKDARALMAAQHVRDLTALPKTTIRDYVQQGAFPQPVTLGPRRIAWRAADVYAWIASRPIHAAWSSDETKEAVAV